MKRQVKYIFLFCFTGYLFLMVFVGFFIVVSIISSHIITESSIVLSIHSPFSQVLVAGFQIWYFFMHFSFFFFFFFFFCTYSYLHYIYHYSMFDLSYIFFHQTYIYICMMHVNIFVSFIPVMILKTFKLKSSVLFGTHSIRQIIKSITTSHTTKLTANGW